MKRAILAVALLVLSGSAMAAESWTAHGIQSVTVSNAGTVAAYMPFAQSGFETEALCNDFIAAQKVLALGSNSSGKTTTRKIDADCSLVRDVSLPE